MSSSNGRRKRKVVAYERELLEPLGPLDPPVDYATKFAGLIEACGTAEEAGADLLVVAHPRVLGDTYDELMESLGRIADAGLDLGVAGREPPRRRR